MPKKVNELEYRRVDAETLIAEIGKLTKKAASAKSAETLAAVRAECRTHMSHFITMSALAEARFTLNTRDAFYSAEHEYYDEQAPAVQNAYADFMRAFLACPAVKDVGKHINPLVVRQYELAVRCTSEETVPMAVEENRLTTEYTKLMSETTFSFRGKFLPLSALKKYFTDADRATRAEAYAVAGSTLSAVSADLDGIYDRMVHVRDRMARTLGYDNFVALGDNRMGRISYGRRDIDTFRENVRAAVVPVVARLKKRTAEALGIDRIRLYDNDTSFAQGNPAPVLSPEEMFAAGRTMYHAMSKETGEFFDFMLETDAFDVFPREGKWGGGYCTSFPDYRQPFILANFNGTSGDVDVLTHEAGHAFADYTMYKLGHDTELNVGGMETAETHSMSMEFFCWKYIDAFFGDRGRDYRFMHLADALTFLPYGTIVDRFQELCYRSPDLSPAERNALWLGLEGEFRPYLSAEGIPYFEKGTRWQYQMHIYENPLYYIDYCLAQTVALQFLLKSVDDYDGAFGAYYRFLSQGGEKEFPALVREAGLKSPFEVGALADTAARAEALLNRL